MFASIENPYFLLLIPCFLALLIFSGRWIRIRNKKRKYMILGLRAAVISFLILALCQIGLTFQGSTTTTIFLVDVSDSIQHQKTEVGDMVKKAIQEMPSKNKVGVIAFGSDSRVEQFVTDKKAFSAFETAPVTTATNLEKAVQAAMALYTEESGKRLVLITDGNENEGSIEKMSSTLTGSHVEVQVLQLENTNAKEVYIDNVSIPDKVNLGDSFQVEVDIYSNVKTSAVLSLYAGSALKSKEEVELQTGDNQFLFKDTQKESGLKGYRVVIEPVEDTILANNEYAAFTQAEKGERILVIEGANERAKEFQKVLKAANITFTTIVPQSAPRTLLECNEYKAIVLLNVHKDDLPESFLDCVESYVKEYAGGLIAIGGEDSFALGGYKGTPLEKALPVYMDLKGEKEIPQMAITMSIDRSGSMSDGDGIITRLDLAKEAAAEALKTLRPQDYIGVVAFSDTFQWVVPIQKAEKLEEIEDTIYSIGLGGGTSIYPSIHACYEKIVKTDAKLKHIILLSDGQDGFNQYDDLLKKINDNQITLSTVAVGDDADIKLMKRLAKEGSGRFYQTDITTDIPRIFAKEVYLSAKSYLNNRTFTPAVTSNSEIIRDVAAKGLPAMHGYIATTKKELATVHLVSDTEEPILTTWQYGLGRSAAFCSDAENKWTSEYAGWNQYPLLWKNLIQWAITDTSGGENSVAMKQVGNQTKISYQAKDYSAETKVTAICTDEAGNSKEVILEATAPGKFEADTSIKDMGIYSVNVRQEENGEIVSSQNTAMAVQYSSEYRIQKKENALDDFVAQVNGSFIKDTKHIFEKPIENVYGKHMLTNFFFALVVLLFFVDIAYRRLHINFVDISRTLLEKMGITFKKDRQKTEIENKKEQKHNEQKGNKAEQKDTTKKKDIQVRKDAYESKGTQAKKYAVKKNENNKKEKKKEKQTGERLDTSALLHKKKERSE